MGKLFGVEEEKSSRMMHCSAPTGAARAATIAIVAGLKARTLAAELRIPKRMFFKANQPSVLAIDHFFSPARVHKFCLNSGVEIIDIEPSDNMPDLNCTSADPQIFAGGTFSHKISHGV